jgi:hypothetical protein
MRGAEMVTAGAGLGVASWDLVISTRVLLSTLAAHKSPDGSKITTKGAVHALGETCLRCHVTVGVGRVHVYTAIRLDTGRASAVPGDRATLGDDDAPRYKGACGKRSR